jgi:hypothetical protein
MNRFWSYIILIILLILVFRAISHCQIPTTDLHAYYPFNGNAQDSLGRGLHGLVTGATPCKDRFGKDSSAYYFDGIDDKIDLSTTVYFKGQKPLTFCFWQKISSTDFVTIAKFYEGGASNYKIAPRITVQGIASSVVTAPVDTNNIWQHIVVVFNTTAVPSSVTIYRNGVCIKGPTQLDYYTGSNEPLLIGYINGDVPANRYYSKGTIDDLIIYGTALTASDVMKIYDPTYVHIVPRPYKKEVVTHNQQIFNLLGQKLRQSKRMTIITNGGRVCSIIP